MQIRVRSPLIACALLWACVLVEGSIKRTSKLDSKLTWVCKDPTDEEKKSMIENGNSGFQFSATYDPVGYGGGCMPDATCVNQKSEWTNVFGYVMFHLQ
jgi:hypothetical protein